MSEPLTTEILSDDPASIDRASDILRGGGLVAFPTETVYGLGADAANDAAVARVFAAKGRPTFNPLIVHVTDRDAAEKLAVFDDHADRLASAFWPGALTLVLPIRDGANLGDLVTAGLNTVALRVPAHPLAQNLLQRFDGAIAAPSANVSGKISATAAAHVQDGLGGRIDAIIDGGICDVGVESTIVTTSPDPKILRPGGIPQDAIEAALGHKVPIAQSESENPHSPGQLPSHYAPHAQLHLDAAPETNPEIWLGFGPEAAQSTLNLSKSADLHEAATNFFAFLRALDALAAEQGIAKISVSPIPDVGLGVALNDRLRRAAAPRP